MEVAVSRDPSTALQPGDRARLCLKKDKKKDPISKQGYTLRENTQGVNVNKQRSLGIILEAAFHNVIDLFRFWRQHVSHLRILFQPIYLVTGKVVFEWGPGQERALQQA